MDVLQLPPSEWQFTGCTEWGDTECRSAPFLSPSQACWFISTKCSSHPVFPSFWTWLWIWSLEGVKGRSSVKLCTFGLYNVGMYNYVGSQGHTVEWVNAHSSVWRRQTLPCVLIRNSTIWTPPAPVLQGHENCPTAWNPHSLLPIPALPQYPGRELLSPHMTLLSPSHVGGKAVVEWYPCCNVRRGP